jgi:SAM-dependent methyltransferase
LNRTGRERFEPKTYWSTRTTESDRNAPSQYASETRARKARSIFLTQFIATYFDTGTRIVEIGCNAGRNLDFLYHAGFHNLTGFDINENAIKMLEESKPHLASKVSVSSIESFVVPEYTELLYSMAVLEHIPYKNDSEIINLLKSAPFILTIEDEFTRSERHFPRNYRRFLSPHGFVQLRRRYFIPGLPKTFVLRLFKNKTVSVGGSESKSQRDD